MNVPHLRRHDQLYLRVLAVLGVVVTMVLLTAHAAGGASSLAWAGQLPGAIQQVWAGSPPPASTGFRWPLTGSPAVVVPFDPPAQPWLPGHRGVDLASTSGALVFAAGAGTVAFVGEVAGVGVVSVEHAGGLRTTYEPVRAVVRAGQAVTAGTTIGILLAGHPGCPPGVPACLHWGLRRGDVYLNPLLLLGRAQVRLLPVAPLPG